MKGDFIMENNKSLELAIERLEALTEEMHRMNQAFAAMRNGMSCEQAFNEYVYVELSNQKKSVLSKLATLMEHLLKIKYCRNSYQDNDWKRTVKHSIDKVIELLDWNSKKRDMTLVNYAMEELQDRYEVAVFMYQKDVKWYSDLEDGIKFIPEECPWTLDELLDSDLKDLLSKLPDPDYDKQYIK